MDWRQPPEVLSFAGRCQMVRWMQGQSASACRPGLDHKGTESGLSIPAQATALKFPI